MRQHDAIMEPTVIDTTPKVNGSSVFLFDHAPLAANAYAECHVEQWATRRSAANPT